MRRISVRTNFPSLIINRLNVMCKYFIFVNSKGKLRSCKTSLKWYKKLASKIFACLFKCIYFYIFAVKSVQFASKIVVDEATHPLTISRNVSSDFVKFPVDIHISFQSSFMKTYGCFQVWVFDCFGGFVFSIRNLCNTLAENDKMTFLSQLIFFSNYLKVSYMEIEREREGASEAHAEVILQSAGTCNYPDSIFLARGSIILQA